MPSEKQTIVYGPWPGGVNMKDHIALLGDDELAVCENLDVNDEGIVKPRKPIRALFTGDALLPYMPIGVTNGGSTLVTVRKNNNATYSFVHLNSSPEELSGLKTVCTFTGYPTGSPYYASSLDYNGYTYYLGNGASASFRVPVGNTSGAVSLITDFPAVTASARVMPFMFKERMFFCTNDRIYYSKATDPTLWTAPDGGFFDVNPGSTSIITGIVVSSDNIYIFKNDGIWVFSFDSDPATDGYLKIITRDQGALAATTSDNEVYFVGLDSVYRLDGESIVDIGRKLNLRGFYYDQYTTASITVFNDKLIAGINGTVYAMNLNNGAWSVYNWFFSEQAGEFTPALEAGKGFVFGYGDKFLAFSDSFGFVDSATRISYLADYFFPSVNTLPQQDKFYNFNTSVQAFQQFYPKYYMVTKQFNLGSRMNWKRLYSIFVDGVGKLFNDSVLMATDYNDHPLEALPSFKTSLQDKLLVKSLRFRGLAFALSSSPDGAEVTRPADILGQEELDPTVRQIYLNVAVKTPVSQ